ncbi:hypothetical protein ACGF12_30340 [Kitasatospora sp. NPDC048296]|uniref:hypothetical protein n=1 Tax=Kitasatospora sp. NPDC048296 TaxID=3364048 RepID=UPI0037220F50
MNDQITRPLPWRGATAVIHVPPSLEQWERMTVSVEVHVVYRVPLRLKFLFTRSRAGVWALEWDGTLAPAGSASGRRAREVLGSQVAELLAGGDLAGPLAELHARALRLDAMWAWERLRRAREEVARAAAKTREAAAEFEVFGMPESECARMFREFEASGDLRKVGWVRSAGGAVLPAGTVGGAARGPVEEGGHQPK